MSRSPKKPPAPADGSAKVERWLAVMAAAVLPVAIALFTPRQHHVLLFVASGLLFVAGLAMFVLQELRSGGEQATAPPYEPTRSVEGDPVDMEGAEP